jgi:hypothetical protein
MSLVIVLAALAVLDVAVWPWGHDSRGGQAWNPRGAAAPSTPGG